MTPVSAAIRALLFGTRTSPSTISADPLHEAWISSFVLPAAVLSRFLAKSHWEPFPESRFRDSVGAAKIILCLTGLNDRS